MRSRKDRRKQPSPAATFQENGRRALATERRKGGERRKANLPLDERQTQYSEMPWFPRDHRS